MTVRHRYLKTRTNKTKPNWIKISRIKSETRWTKGRNTHTHFLHDEHQLLNMSHPQWQLTHVNVTHSAWFGSIQLFVEGGGGHGTEVVTAITKEQETVRTAAPSAAAGDGTTHSWTCVSFCFHAAVKKKFFYQTNRNKPHAHADNKRESYLHENRLAEFFSVDNLYGDFLTRDAVDAELHQTWNTDRKNINIRWFIQSLSDSLCGVKERSKSSDVIRNS